MPQLPGIPRLQSGAAQGGRQASAADFGAAPAAAQAQRAGLLGDVGQIAGQAAQMHERIRDARESVRMERALTEADLDREQWFDAAKDDPDENTLEERFAKSERERVQQRAGGIDPGWRGEFEQRSQLSGVRASARVRDLVRGKRIAGSQVDAGAKLDGLADLFARAGPDDRPEFGSQAAELVGRMRAQGIYSEPQAQAALEGWKQRATEGAWLAGKNQDPQGTLEDVRHSRDGFEHMTEPRRQQAIASLEDEVRQRKEFDRARVTEARIAADRAQHEREEKVTKDLLFAAANKTLTVDMIQQHAPDLSPSTVSQLLNATRHEFNPEATPNPTEYYRLRLLAATDPQAFVDEKIDREAVGLNNALSLIDAQAAARKKDPVVTGDNFEGRWAKRLADMGGLDDEERAHLFRIGEARLQEYQERTKERPGPKEEQQIIDEVLLQNTRDTRRLFGILGSREVVEIPDAFRARAAASLARKGQPSTEAAIRQLYDNARTEGVQ